MHDECAKKIVRCTIVATNDVRYVGENSCENPQHRCPRNDGEDYTKCRTICQQTAHAEINALRLAGDSARGSVAYLEGHDHCCDNCIQAMEKAGVKSIVRGTPPPFVYK